MNYKPNGKITLGIGLTSRCNSQCTHCYSRSGKAPADLTFASVKKIIDYLPLKSINFGTGESIFHPDFFKILEYIAERDIEMAVTTNGTTTAQLSDEQLQMFHDIDFSLDFPTKSEHDAWRGEGMFDAILSGIERCLKLGVEASLVACLMKQNYHCLGDLALLAVKIGVNLRVNLYKPVHSPAFKPGYDEFWYAVKAMADKAFFIVCTEPIVCAAIGKNGGKSAGSPCGMRSLRIHPEGKVIPCVYLNDSEFTVDDIIDDYHPVLKSLQKVMDLTPDELCLNCEHFAVCQGGCTARRIFDGRTIDEYCFIRRGEKPVIDVKWKKSKNLVHEDYLCTMIFSG